MIFERDQSGKRIFMRELLRLRGAAIDSRFFAAFLFAGFALCGFAVLGVFARNGELIMKRISLALIIRVCLISITALAQHQLKPPPKTVAWTLMDIRQTGMISDRLIRFM